MAIRELQIRDRAVTVYDEGHEDGPVILWHNGTPAGPEPFGPWVDDVLARGARLVSYARPGYDGSTPAPGRTVADAAADVTLVLDELGIERCVTWGISGGGPHALACAALLADRVVAAASLAGVAPFDAAGLNYFRGMGADNLVEFGLAMAGREHIASFCEEAVAARAAATPAEIGEQFATLISGPDTAVLDGPVGGWLASSMALAFTGGAHGWIDDDLAFLAPFGFELAAIRVPTLIVHGREDRFVPFAHGEWLAGAVPNAEAWLLDGIGHLGLAADKVRDVHTWLLGQLD